MAAPEVSRSSPVLSVLVTPSGALPAGPATKVDPAAVAVAPCPLVKPIVGVSTPVVSVNDSAEPLGRVKIFPLGVWPVSRRFWKFAIGPAILLTAVVDDTKFCSTCQTGRPTFASAPDPG